MRKRRANDEDVLAFIRALYGEYAELALAGFDERTVLNYAVETIERLRRERDEAQALLRESRRVLNQCSFAEHPDVATMIDCIDAALGEESGT